MDVVVLDSTRCTTSSSPALIEVRFELDRNLVVDPCFSGVGRCDDMLLVRCRKDA